MSVHEITIHVYPTDCDMLGHVNHATMITFLEHARWALIETHMAARDFMRGGAWSVVRHVDISYHAQSLPGEDLVIRSGLLSVGRTSFRIRQEVRKGRADGQLAADATIAFVCVDREGRPVAVPAEWSAMFPRWPEDAGVATPDTASAGGRRRA
ncbi:MAG: acyl-CoA thioesterase [Gemmatimonadaceae bacterium]